MNFRSCMTISFFVLLFPVVLCAQLTTQLFAQEIADAFIFPADTAIYLRDDGSILQRVPVWTIPGDSIVQTFIIVWTDDFLIASRIAHDDAIHRAREQHKESDTFDPAYLTPHDSVIIEDLRKRLKK